jgi:hypothetical protein
VFNIVPMAGLMGEIDAAILRIEGTATTDPTGISQVTEALETARVAEGR